jgi:hypothetical protein
MLLFPLAAAAQVAPAPQTPAPAPAPAASAEKTTDAAAIGFLKTVVDKRLYSLEGAGAARMTGSIHAKLEIVAKNADVKPAEIDLAVRCEYATGQAALQPTTPPTPEQAQVAPFAISAAQNAFSFLPSRATKQWAITFAHDDKLVRLDYKLARQDPNAGSWSEWHAADGTPVRRQVSSVRPVNGASEPIVQEIKPVFLEKKGLLLLSELKPGDAGGRFSWSFEYEEKDGFQVLKKIVEENEGWRLTLDFKLDVTKAAAR